MRTSERHQDDCPKPPHCATALSRADEGGPPQDGPRQFAKRGGRVHDDHPCCKVNGSTNRWVSKWQNGGQPAFVGFTPRPEGPRGGTGRECARACGEAARITTKPPLILVDVFWLATRAVHDGDVDTAVPGAMPWCRQFGAVSQARRQRGGVQAWSCAVWGRACGVRRAA